MKAHLEVRPGLYVMRSGAIARVKDKANAPCLRKGKETRILIFFGHEVGASSRKMMWTENGKRAPQRRQHPDDLIRRKRGR